MSHRTGRPGLWIACRRSMHHQIRYRPHIPTGHEAKGKPRTRQRSPSRFRMPLPKPHSDEDKDAFIGRCMANPTMRDEFPDGAQRRAVCERQWDEDGKAREKDAAEGLGRPVAAIKD